MPRRYRPSLLAAVASGAISQLPHRCGPPFWFTRFPNVAALAAKIGPLAASSQRRRRYRVPISVLSPPSLRTNGLSTVSTLRHRPSTASGNQRCVGFITLVLPFNGLDRTLLDSVNQPRNHTIHSPATNRLQSDIRLVEHIADTLADSYQPCHNTRGAHGPPRRTSCF